MKNLDLLLPQKQVATDSFTWATVTAVDPLRIRLDGEQDALDLTPDALVPTFAVGNRVWCQVHGRRVIVLGISGGSPT